MRSLAAAFEADADVIHRPALTACQAFSPPRYVAADRPAGNRRLMATRAFMFMLDGRVIDQIFIVDDVLSRIFQASDKGLRLRVDPTHSPIDESIAIA